MSLPKLDYEREGQSGRRCMAVLLLLLQIHAAAMTIGSALLFWWYLIYGLWQFAIDIDSFDDVEDLIEVGYGSALFVTPFTLSGILFVLCSMSARANGGRHAGRPKREDRDSGIG